MDSKLIAEKIIQCFNVYVVKYREKSYNLIEKNPDRAEEIKRNMIIDNIYFRRMLFDSNFKKYMMKNLNDAFMNGEITKNSIKRLLVSIIDELERPSESFFDIFNKPSKGLPNIEIVVIQNHADIIIDMAKTNKRKQSIQTFSMRDKEFLKRLIETVEPDTTLYRALEDLIVEYESGIFYSRYYEPGEINKYMMHNINPYIRASLNNQGSLVFNQLEKQTLRKLCPEFYINIKKITDHVFQALKDIVNLPESLKNNFFLMQSIHIMDILMSLIFERNSYEDKLRILNDLYEFTLNIEEVQFLSENINNFIDSSFFPENFRANIPNKNDSKFANLFQISQNLFKMELHSQCLMVNQLMHENEKDLYKKALTLDNIATGYRDLRVYDKAIDKYSEVLKYYENNGEHYRAFVAKKNIAFCYFKKGNKKKAEELYQVLENDFSKYKPEELGGVYLNLAYRNRLQYNFKKEDYFLSLTLEALDPKNLQYQNVLERSIEIEKFFNLGTIKFDLVALENHEREINYSKNLRNAKFYQLNLNITLARHYVETAYEYKEKDIEYYNFISIGFLLKNQWEDLKNACEQVFNRNPRDFIGNYNMSIFYLSQKDNINAFNHLLLAAKGMAKKDLNFWEEMEILNKFLYFCCQLYSHNEIIQLIDDIFKRYESNPMENKPIRNIIISMGSIFISNNEKSLSKHIFKKHVDIEQNKGSYDLFALWAFRFKEFDIAKEYLEKVLNITPNDIDILMKISQVCSILNNFEESIIHVDHAISLVEPERKRTLKTLKEHVITIRDNKIRFESLPYEDVKIVFNTVEYSLKTLNPNEKIEFGNIITEISKGIELLLGATLGRSISKYVKQKYPSIPNYIKYGNKRGIRPVHTLIMNFLNDPKEHNMVLGNWLYIFKGVKKKLDPKNPLMKEIYYFIETSHEFTELIIEKVLSLGATIIEDRNKGTHKRLYSKHEIEVLLRKITPDLNSLIEQLK